MKRVVIESPYASADLDERILNIRYARECMRRALVDGYAPTVSHLLYTQPGVLDDTIPKERTMGIDAGLEFHDGADQIIFCLGRGWSKGMLAAFFYAVDSGNKSRMVFWDTEQFHWKLSRWENWDNHAFNPMPVHTECTQADFIKRAVPHKYMEAYSVGNECGVVKL